MNDKERYIKENWFNNHVATYSEQGNLKVLDWKKPGTITYYTRFIFDRNKMYVSGDIGEAVFCFTEPVDVHVVAKYALGYFEGKLRAYHEARRDFDNDKAVKRLRKWLISLKESGIKYDHDDMREFFDEARNCNSTDEWGYIVNKTSFISKLDQDYWEWIFNIGDAIPWRIHGYLIALKMASEQLLNGKDV